MNEPVQGRILFVDDDASLRTVVKVALSRDGYSVDVAANGDEALASFTAGTYDLVIQDIRMPGMGGLDLLTRLRERDETVPVVVMTAFSSWDVAVEAMRRGAFDYLKKPFDNDELRQIARRAILYRRNGLADNDGGSRLIGNSPAMQAVRSVVEQVSGNDSTVCISGESGTGKELVAALLHSRSPRREGPFVAVNCGGFSETLLESELFGHVRGAFTGAVAEKRGLIGLADGGTFFLGEVGEMTLSTQVRLLRVLETRTYFPVGGEESRSSDVRFICATNRDLLEMVDSGLFRQDLYYRLNVIPIHVPPLRE
ncbi:MAG: sigma-54 dependent transcriptional regulator, partial [Planctomycetaceae bacterium]|nr:sigma-54 dependent transcriptional regulator [Planctomycetaceae bacterium]